MCLEIAFLGVGAGNPIGKHSSTGCGTLTQELKCCRKCGAYYTCAHKGECCPECEFLDPDDDVCLAVQKPRKAKKERPVEEEPDEETFLFEDEEEEEEQVITPAAEQEPEEEPEEEVTEEEPEEDLFDEEEEAEDEGGEEEDSDWL